MRLVALLNRRFAAGAPSNRLDDAGCLIRQFDGLEEVLQPWLPCGSDAEAWCYKYSDRWPTSIVNRRARHVWFDQPRDNGGLVLAGAAQVRCAYPGDGDSMSDSKLCDPLGGDGVHCIPGCLPVGQQCPELRRDWECSFPPSALRTALEHQLGSGNIERNNEVVIDPASVASRLPHSVLAFWHKPRGEDAQRVARHRDKFLHQFRLDPGEVPLLVMDLSPDAGDEPFSLSTVLE